LNLLFEVLDHLRVNKQLFRDRCHISIDGANSAMAKAVADCFWLHIHAPGCNSNVHSLEDVDLLGVCYLVLKALNEEAIETTPIVSLEAPDNSCVVATLPPSTRASGIPLTGSKQQQQQSSKL
jgi:Flp pilus assembly CpaF family ATPase